MSTWFNLGGAAGFAEPVFPSWILWQTKGIVFLLLALVLARPILRRSSAATRHLYWAGVLAGLLLLPAFSSIVAAWEPLTFLPAEVAPSSTLPVAAVTDREANDKLPAIPVEMVAAGAGNAAPNSASFDRSAKPNARVDDIDSTPIGSDVPAVDLPIVPGSADPAIEQEPAISLSPPGIDARHAVQPQITYRRIATAVLAVWALGVFYLTLRLGVSFSRLAGLRRSSRPVADGPIFELVSQTASDLGVGRRPVLIASAERSVPMTWGVFQSVILLPERALAWPHDRLRLVLAHELSHVHRCDSFVDLLTRMVCILHWINLPAWWVLSRMRLKREQACDDVVLKYAAHPAHYAETLLAVAHDASSRHFVADAALMIVGQSQFERRLRALLDETQNHRGVAARRLVAGLVVVTALAAPLAALQPKAANAVDSSSAVAIPADAADEASSDKNVLAAQTIESKKKAAAESEDPNLARPLTVTKKRDLIPGPPVSAKGFVVGATGNPIAGATVYLREWSLLRYSRNLYDPHPRDLLATTKSNERGEFEFKNVESNAFGRDDSDSAPWDILAVAPGSGLAGQHLKSANDTDKIQISLPAEKAVSGQVLDEQGKPIAGAAVSVTSIADLDADATGEYTLPGIVYLGFSELAPRTRTDAEGRFRLAAVPADRRLGLEFSHDEFLSEHVSAAATVLPIPTVMTRTFVDGKTGRKPLEVKTGDLAITLKPGRRVFGQVVFADTRQPAEGAKIMLFRQSRPWSAIADGAGRFVLNNIPDAGSYSLSATLPDGSEYLNRSLPIEIADDQRRLDVEVALPRGQVVEGFVVDEETEKGIVGVTVSNTAIGESNPDPGKDRLFSSIVTTDANGRFRMLAKAGKRTINIKGPVAGYDLPDRITALRDPKRRIEQEIEVVAGRPTPEVRFRVGPGLVIEGVVTDPDGKSLAGANVKRFVRYEFSKDDPLVVTDAEGRFRLRGLSSAVPQRIIVSHPERNLKGRLDVPAAPESIGKKRVVPVELQAQIMSRVVGRATDGSKPLVGIRVSVHGFVTENGVTNGDPTEVVSRTDADGRFTLELVDIGRDLHLMIHEDGYELPSLVRFNLKSGEMFEYPAITMRRLDQTVSGIVVDPDGNPVEGATIAASDRSTRRPISLTRGESTVTDKDGRFTMRHLPNAPLSLMAFFRSPPEVTDRTIRFPGNADADPGDTDVRIILDPKLSRGAAKKIKIGDSPKKD